MKEYAQAVGVPWFTRGDFDEAMLLMADRHRLPRTFDEWEKKALGQESELRALGYRTERVIVNPQSLRYWCADRGLAEVDAKARSAYAMDITYRRRLDADDDRD